MQSDVVKSTGLNESNIEKIEEEVVEAWPDLDGGSDFDEKSLIDNGSGEVPADQLTETIDEEEYEDDQSEKDQIEDKVNNSILKKEVYEYQE